VLTADLVTARRRGDELRLAPSDDARRTRVAALAEALTARARAELGRPRDDVEEALRVDRNQTQLVAAPARGHEISGKHCGRAAGRW